jgi:hypothetical protein
MMAETSAMARSSKPWLAIFDDSFQNLRFVELPWIPNEPQSCTAFRATP